MSIKCHSAYVHYNMFHDSCHCIGHSHNSVFNAVPRCNGGHLSFWGGLGLGLGMGLGSLFGGMFNSFIGGFYNMFNSFGNMFNGFGGMFGNYGNMFNWWGGVSGNNSPSKINNENKNIEDKDCQKIADFQQEVNDLAKKANITPEEITALRTRITNAKNTSDNYNVDANNKSYDELLRQLDALQTGGPKVADGQGTVGTGNIDPSKVTASTNTDNWTKDDIEKLSANDAKDILNKLGCLDTDGNAKMSTNYNTLLLIKQAEVNVKVAKNTKPGLTDSFIQGKITDVKKDANDKITFTIDNSVIDNAAFGFVYTFKQCDDEDKAFNITKIDKNGKTDDAYLINGWQDRKYVFENDILTIENAAPLLKKKAASGYTQLQ